MELNLATLNKWIPYKLVDTGTETLCEWLYTGGEKFNRTFFDNTIGICRRFPQNAGPQKNITSIAQLLEWAAQINVEEPTAIIFHISRCGSTIVSQALANNTDNTVLSEVPFFDDVLQYSSAQVYGQGVLLNAVIKLYSQPKNGLGSKVFIKTDSWHIMLYEQLRQIFPRVPFILLYRNPAEVVRSLNKGPGRHCIPQFIDPGFFGIREQVVTAEDFYNYPIKVIEKYFEAFIEVIEKDNNAFLFNYNDGMVKVVEDIFKVIGLSFTENNRAQMQEQLMYHSKTPGMFFSPEPPMQISDDKFAYVLELYNRLEELRTGTKQ